MLSVTSITEACDDIVTITDSADGEWTGQVIVSAPDDEAIEGWDLQLVFSAPIDYLGRSVVLYQLQPYELCAECVSGTVTGSGSVWTISSKDWDSSIPAGGQLELNFIVLHSGAADQTPPTVLRVQLNDDMLCGGGDVCQVSATLSYYYNSKRYLHDLGGSTSRTRSL